MVKYTKHRIYHFNHFLKRVQFSGIKYIYTVGKHHSPSPELPHELKLKLHICIKLELPTAIPPALATAILLSLGARPHSLAHVRKLYSMCPLVPLISVCLSRVVQVIPSIRISFTFKAVEYSIVSIYCIKKKINIYLFLRDRA